ncbi:MAG TPA: M14 family metallopeptidase [Fimbriimonadaceae bacterium]|nr:M14 family metallopeptidase [Fimbriimonadaceae bacterium]
MPRVEFDRYYRYDELTSLLKAFAKEHPGLVQMESIGKSHEGRDIWLMTVTDKSTGAAADKPAFWADGNIHASEVSASTTMLKMLDLLCKEKPEVLKTRAFYLVPRLNPDGAEWALEDVPRIIRSSTRPYPFDEDDPYGLEKQDLDGDGRILNMRVEDPNGAWKVSEEEPRLMKKRGPGETGGTYYRLLTEGLFHNFDNVTMRARQIKEGLDLNRNFPNDWRLEQDQHGAGPYPTSEPEIHAAVDAISKRPNICGGVTYHTFSGVILRAPGRKPEDDLPPEDLWLLKEMGKHGTEMTGYPCISVFHDFKYHPKDSISGVFDDWMYEHRGVHAWTVEIWSPQRQAGITDYKYIDWFREHPHEDDLKMLKWSDEKLGGKGHVEWYEFDHPQLGKVELGGWDSSYAFRNPPPDYLEKEVEPLARWGIWLAGLSPCLVLKEVIVDPVGDAHRIRMVVQNTGWMATNVSKLAEKKKMCRGVVGEIEKSGEAVGGAGSSAPEWLVSGLLRQEGGQLAGWAHIPAAGFGWQMNATDDQTVFEWVVQGPGTYGLTAKHERAGTVRTSVTV